jgi:1-acyl-sn-glycerol-3-phosphate acyltransferase
VTRRRLGFWYRLAVVLLRRPLLLLTKRDWHGVEHLPKEGGIVAVTNHVSHFDPLAFAHFLYDNGRLPLFLGKAAIFRVPLVGTILRGARQIPVYRESADATKAYTAAVDAVRRGECVAIYPEATISRDPGLWPMMGKTGAARVALVTGAPVIPIAQTMHLKAGPPVDLSEFTHRPMDTETLHLVTEKIMAAITVLLEDIRGEQAPAVRFDPRTAGLPPTGDPRRINPGKRSA